MSWGQFDFGQAVRLEADALGEPGKRTFRLLVQASDHSFACLWLEKEQLQGLGLAIEQLLGQLPVAPMESDQPPPAAGPFPSNPSVEFKIGRLALGYAEDVGRFIILAHELEADPEGAATFACQASRSQLRALADQIAAVIAAGRPRCPLCLDPMEKDQVHHCVRSNGHYHG